MLSQKTDASNEARIFCSNIMEYNAIAKNVKVSPRKVRLVADQIRELNVASALTTLMVSRKRGAVSLKKALESAIANAVNNNSAKKDDLRIKTINVTEGIRYKRYHFAGRGRSRPYVKRTSHINVILEDSVTREMPVLNMEPKQEEIKKDNEKETEKKGGKAKV